MNGRRFMPGLRPTGRGGLRPGPGSDPPTCLIATRPGVRPNQPGHVPSSRPPRAQWPRVQPLRREPRRAADAAARDRLADGSAACVPHPPAADGGGARARRRARGGEGARPLLPRVRQPHRGGALRRSAPTRGATTRLICVVEQPVDVVSLERTRGVPRPLPRARRRALAARRRRAERPAHRRAAPPRRRERRAGGRARDQPEHDRRGDRRASSPTGYAAASASRGSRAGFPSAATSSTPTRSPSAGRSPAAARCSTRWTTAPGTARSGRRSRSRRPRAGARRRPRRSTASQLVAWLSSTMSNHASATSSVPSPPRSAPTHGDRRQAASAVSRNAQRERRSKPDHATSQCSVSWCGPARRASQIVHGSRPRPIGAEDDRSPTCRSVGGRRLHGLPTLSQMTTTEFEAVPAVERRAARTPGLVVMKFGGTSVGDADEAEARRAARSSRRARPGARSSPSLSAMGDTTDELIRLAHEVSPTPAPARVRHARLGRRADLERARARWRSTTSATRPSRSPARRRGSSPTRRTRRRRSSRCARRRIHEALDARRDRARRRLPGRLRPTSHDVTTLGRGGSDTTAVALAAALGADACEIFTDVARRLHRRPAARPERAQARRASAYEEMLEMAASGAGVMARARSRSRAATV